MNKKARVKLLLLILAALIFLMMYLIAHYVVIPKLDILVDTAGEMMWLIQAVIKILKVLPAAGFWAALYFIGRIFHFDSKYSEQAVVTGRDAYGLADEIFNLLKAKQIQPSDTVADAVKRIHDILKIETEFGIGSERIIVCETEIYHLLKDLENYTRMYCTQTGSEAVEQELLECCADINGKLRLRMELNKR